MEPNFQISYGCLAKYASMATSADTGAVLKWYSNIIPREVSVGM
jgi:hypothetical protein